MWHAQIFTIFPEMFPGSLGQSLAGKALENGIWGYETINIRDFATDKHSSVDDSPYGGGAGMVMRADVLGKALENKLENDSKLIYMSPRGKVFSQNMAYELANCKKISIVCGRFEGVDERVLQHFNAEEVSIGDYILSGGEVAATVLMDACIRLLPGVIGNESTHEQESFSENENFTGLLEYPLYTRPSNWNGLRVPDVLVSGNHAEIDKWRLSEAEKLTKARRPDLWQKYLEKRGKENGS